MRSVDGSKWETESVEQMSQLLSRDAGDEDGVAGDSEGDVPRSGKLRLHQRPRWWR